MASFLKPGKVVIVLQGRHAGKKAVIANTYEPNELRPYPHALVIGINRYPKPVHGGMTNTKIRRRSRVFPFIKVINLSHLLPTRYSTENLEDVLGKVNLESYAQATRDATKKVVKSYLQEHYYSGKNSWFYTPLRF